MKLLVVFLLVISVTWASQLVDTDDNDVEANAEPQHEDSAEREAEPDEAEIEEEDWHFKRVPGRRSKLYKQMRYNRACRCKCVRVTARRTWYGDNARCAACCARKASTPEPEWSQQCIPKSFLRDNWRRIKSQLRDRRAKCVSMPIFSTSTTTEAPLPTSPSD